MGDQISGTWRNQLGSKLTLETDGDGGLRGSYRPGAPPLPGAASLRRRASPLCGAYDPASPGPVTVLAFVVDWTDVHSVTSWVGRYDRGADRIEATWMMASEAAEADAWRSTVVGHDTFVRSDQLS